MKTTFVLIALVAGLGVATTAWSQNEKKEGNDPEKDKVTVRVRMSEEKNGKTETIEKTYTYNKLTVEEREAKIKAIVDSLRGPGKDTGNRRLSIIIEEGNSSNTDRIGWNDRVIVSPGDGRNRVRIYQYGPGNNRVETWNDGKGHYEFNFDENAFADRMKRIERRIEPQMRRLERNMDNWSRDFEPKFRNFWNGDVVVGSANKPASIRSLEVFPNNPDKDELNIRFYAPNKGDVTISVTDTKGKQVAKKEVKDFSGDYVGQLELGKNAKGTYFISVVQNEDGTVKRIVLE